MNQLTETPRTPANVAGGKSFQEIYLKKIHSRLYVGCWFVYFESIPLRHANIYDEEDFNDYVLPVLLNQPSRKSNDSQIIESENIIKREDGSIAFQFTGHNYDEIKPLFDLARVRCECVLPEGSNFPKLFCSVRDVKEHKGIRYQIFPGGWMVYNPDNIGVSHPVYYQDYVYYHCSLDEFIKLL